MQANVEQWMTAYLPNGDVIVSVSNGRLILIVGGARSFIVAPLGTNMLEIALKEDPLERGVPPLDRAAGVVPSDDDGPRSEDIIRQIRGEE